MTIRIAIHHKTSYEFDRPVELYPHILRLRPAPHCRIPIRSYSLKVKPFNHFINWQQDPFGNYQARLVFQEKTTHLSFEVEVIADLTAINPFDCFVEDYAENFPFTYDEQLKRELASYLTVDEEGPLLEAWLGKHDQFPKRTIEVLAYLNQAVQKGIGYGIRLEPGIQTCEETLSLAKGSCRDTAWLLIQILRRLGLAARFASGYLVQLTADVPSLDGPSGPEKDFTDLHAWCEVYLPGAGWIGLDPTSGLFAAEGHIPLACTPEPQSAAPITGATGECKVEFSYHNEVSRVLEDPRVTKPYTDAEWLAIKALGDSVDTRLGDQDVRLTMGGEPTFVSIDDMESPQWTMDALGDDKLKRAKELLLRLRDEFAPTGVLHYGQGKWYPGEQLPRWALGCYWRKDGEPLWRDPRWLARVDRSYGFDTDVAERFIACLANELGLADSYVIPAYEDTLYYLWKEGQLPENLDPRRARLDDDLDRRRLARVLSRGLNLPAGFVLPLGWNHESTCWQSSHWPLRNDVLALIPGDSPLGLRLPLDSLPWQTREERQREWTPECDPFAPQLKLPASGLSIVGEHGSPAPDNTPRPQSQEAGDQWRDLTRTAMCCEEREGRIYLFLPPLKSLEHYVALIETIEQVACHLEVPVILEGYDPPRDSRLCALLVTPDPGVIEVNIHPAHNWRDLVTNTETLYEAARQTRLATEKFMLDGRHTGTGGGNHVTLGGAQPADSPFLRRPDLLRSFLTYWQHHPGLSYLFSGMFIGPTSQAPRVDEGRDEMLYELEIAFQQMPDGLVDKPWLVDRLLRNLLIDITGNTHRSEFCIDKLYAPGTASGRQGLLEFRGFEMPPHARMSLVQMLLLRCLVARFWREPYHKPLVRWGTLLHDRFMLPHYVWADIREVVRDLQEQGFPFQLDWLRPFEEFRFPHYGRLQVDNIQFELRWAIEPWHVLGEEVSSFGTARYVDSSVERVQVKLDGLTDGRYVLACNGRRVPLRPTGVKGQYVAGVRYRAWHPESALHPTIGIQSPLVFDIVDTWNNRSIGGCTYHVVHAGGLSYHSFPVNAVEAESRRVNRFWQHGHTPGPWTKPPEPAGFKRTFTPHEMELRPMMAPAEEPAPEYPHTLDLRAGA